MGIRTIIILKLTNAVPINRVQKLLGLMLKFWVLSPRSGVGVTNIKEENQ